MNYIELINQFWQARRMVQLTSNEADLYFFLLQESNLRGWENPFECPNRLIVLTLGMSEKTLIEVRNRLQQKGFITFEAGQRRKKSPVYTLLACANEVKKTASRKKTAGQPTQQPSAVLKYPFASERFAQAWQKLQQTPNWQKKTQAALQLALDKLRDFEEEFAVTLIEQAVIGGWQGVVFSDTHVKYKNWLARRGGANMTNHRNEKSYARF